MTGARFAPDGRAGLRRTALASLVVALLLSAAACTGDDEPDAVEQPTTSAPTTPPETAEPPRLRRPEARWHVTMEQIRGVDRSRRPQIAAGIERAVSRWVRGAYRGEYPRRDFSAAFASWTADAARLAVRDRTVTTNAALGRDLVQVVADRLDGRLYVFGSGGVAGGATAKVVLRFTGVRPGGELAAITVRGNVLLTRDGGPWRIFGYDLDRSVKAR